MVQIKIPAETASATSAQAPKAARSATRRVENRKIGRIGKNRFIARSCRGVESRRKRQVPAAFAGGLHPALHAVRRQRSRRSGSPGTTERSESRGGTLQRRDLPTATRETRQKRRLLTPDPKSQKRKKAEMQNPGKFAAHSSPGLNAPPADPQFKAVSSPQSALPPRTGVRWTPVPPGMRLNEPPPSSRTTKGAEEP
jgi:hypothetical protein